MTIVNTLQENETLDNGLYFAIVVKKITPSENWCIKLKEFHETYWDKAEYFFMDLFDVILVTL